MEERFVRFKELRLRVGLSRSTIWRLVQTDQFPRPRRIAKSATGWLASEVDSWIQERAHSEELK